MSACSGAIRQKRSAPTSSGAALQKMQESAYGGLSKSMQRELDRLVTLMIAKPGEPLNVARRAQSGTVLVRDWKGKSHRVMIMDEGFGYDGHTYSNLRSEDAPVALPCGKSIRSNAVRQNGPEPTMAAKRIRAGHGL
jgi:hypothetical protein